MESLISPKYQMKLIENIENALWAQFQTSKYYNVEKYIEKWQNWEDRYDGNYHIGHTPHFNITKQGNSDNIDLKSTLHNIDGETLLKIAIDLGVDTPDFIPSIPTFRNEIKSNYQTASAIFEKAFKSIESDPSVAVGLANSALESIIKEIMKDDRINTKIKKGDTLYALVCAILKEFSLFPNSKMPEEIKTIGSSLIAACQSIERLRSEKTEFHGKTEDDYIVSDSLYVYFIVNTLTTVGLFLNSFYKRKYPILATVNETKIDDGGLPF